jgi:Ca-activated chloride channel homolog
VAIYQQPQTRRTNPWPFIATGIVVVLLLAVGAFVLFKPSGSCSGTVRLRVAASQDKVGLLQQAGDAFSKDREINGKCVSVSIDAKNSGSALNALARGWDELADGAKPDVWSPASTQWATLLKTRAPQAPTGEPQPIMTSPLTIAMPRPMAEALGWPGKQIGWKDLADLATSEGWATKGHPEWGAFRLGKTNPNFSTSGFNATVAAYFAATGSASDLTLDDVADPKTRTFIQNIEKSIVHYGDTTLTFLANLQRADDRGEALKYISAVTVEESSVWNYNQGNPSLDPALAGKHPKPKIPLVSIYPAEGTLLSDHPYVPLTWMSPEKQKVSQEFFTYLRGDAAQKLFQGRGFRSFEGKPGPQINQAAGLLPEQPTKPLTLPGAEVLNGVLKSWTELRKPAKVLVVIDKSGSMNEKVPDTAKSKLELAKAAAIDSLSEFADQDEVALWQFSSKLDGDKDYQELSPFAKMNPAHRAQLKESLSGIRVSGGTGLYNSTAAAYDAMRKVRASGTINAVVVMTDGQNDRAGGIDLETLTGRLSNTDGEPVRVFTLAFGAGADLKVLKQIADAADGAVYDSTDPGSISEVFTELISNF